MRIALFFIGFILAFGAYSQNTDEELAAHYYTNGEYEKALVLYKRLSKEKPNSTYIYSNHLTCLLALEDQRQAVSLVKSKIKRQPENVFFQVDLAYVYQQFGEIDRMQDQLDGLVKNYAASSPQAVNQLMQALMKRQFNAYAIKLLEKSIELQGMGSYWLNLMTLYRYEGEYEKATDLGLNVLRVNSRQLQLVLYQFTYLVEQEDIALYVQRQTLLYAQKYPSNPSYDELLIQLFLLRKNYDSALRQAIALDKRLNEDGGRVYSLARTCVQNKSYEAAVKAYDYLAGKGAGSQYYLPSRAGSLNAHYLSITSMLQPSDSSVQAITFRFENFIKDFGHQRETAYSMKTLATLYLNYTFEAQKAIDLLQQILVIPGLQSHLKGEVKLLLGDAYLVTGDIWESRLLYGQVDKSFKEDPLGQEAKFRSARLSYFTGDFDWAREQLDILKTATSQLISNNAIHLALLIQENTGLDTTEEAMKEYARIEFLVYQHKYSEALRSLDIMGIRYFSHPILDEVLFLKGSIMQKTGNSSGALSYFEKVYTQYSSDILADNALFAAAQIELGVHKNIDRAVMLLERIVLDYPSSLYVIESRKLLNELEDNLLP